jgi:hypothetical protein
MAEKTLTHREASETVSWTSVLKQACSGAAMPQMNWDCLSFSLFS